MPTLETVFNKLGEPLPLGYCNVGQVIAVGDDVAEFQVGDRVASNGQHAEFVSIPKNLVAKIPDSITDEEAAFTVIGSIGLQGIRLVEPTLGETIVVTGLGLIGLMTAQLLKANGCNVIGIDFDQSKLDIAETFGIQTINPASGDDPVKTVNELTNGIGADGVIITASTKSNDVISQAAQMSRKRGRIVLVGVIGLDSKLLQILGRLKFRTSYGQNQLQHALEVSRLSGLLAAELGANISVCKKGGLLHDIGKAGTTAWTVDKNKIVVIANRLQGIAQTHFAGKLFHEFNFGRGNVAIGGN